MQCPETGTRACEKDSGLWEGVIAIAGIGTHGGSPGFLFRPTGPLPHSIMMGKLPLGVVSPYVKMSSGGCSDPLKFYATSYCTAYGKDPPHTHTVCGRKRDLERDIV